MVSFSSSAPNAMRTPSAYEQPCAGEKLDEEPVRLDERGEMPRLKHLHHPVVGDFAVTYEALTVPDSPDQLIVTYTAEPGSPDESALRLLASWGA